MISESEEITDCEFLSSEFWRGEVPCHWDPLSREFTHAFFSTIWFAAFRDFLRFPQSFPNGCIHDKTSSLTEKANGIGRRPKSVASDKKSIKYGLLCYLRRLLA